MASFFKKNTVVPTSLDIQTCDCVDDPSLNNAVVSCGVAHDSDVRRRLLLLNKKNTVGPTPLDDDIPTRDCVDHPSLNKCTLTIWSLNGSADSATTATHGIE
jgi:hypothetical protein